MVIIYNLSSSADVNCNVVVKKRSRLNCGFINPTFFILLYELRREIPLVQWTLRIYFSMINTNTVLNSSCLGCS